MFAVWGLRWSGFVDAPLGGQVRLACVAVVVHIREDAACSLFSLRGHCNQHASPTEVYVPASLKPPTHGTDAELDQSLTRVLIYCAVKSHDLLPRKCLSFLIFRARLKPSTSVILFPPSA